MNRLLKFAALGVLALSSPLAAQDAPKVFIEGRGGIIFPTFEIDDVVEVGTGFGATLGFHLSPSLVLMGEFDRGVHSDEATGEIDITSTHFMGKLGFAMGARKEVGWNLMLNLGAGMVHFDFEGSDEGNDYFAINAGAKLAYNFSRSVAIVLSPQGDIAFTEENELGSSTAWLWPLTAGLRISF